jgi:4-hydroxy-3-methylbut-2-enyl diphosphate reductase
MKVLLANPRGFCAGVNMAIDVVDQVLDIKGAPVYVYHEIVHNLHVVNDFRARGVTFVDDVSEVPEGGVVVYSAHGVSPLIRKTAKQRRLVEIDATCPLVTKVHLEVLRFAKQGYTIVFIGHRNHDEAIGTVGEAPESIVVVESVEEVERLQVANPDKLAYVTQTTLSLGDAERIIAALKAKFPNIKAPPKEDICYATTNRQRALRQVAGKADLVLVVGSENSSNSKRLVEAAERLGLPAHLVDDVDGIDLDWLAGAHTIGLTAGASAPDELVDAVIDAIGGLGPLEVSEARLALENVHFIVPKEVRTS